MEFCIISPTAGLERYAVLSKWHLVLAPVVLKDEKYKKFYQDRRTEGDFIILDNGSYEGHRMMHLDVLSFIQPNVVVLPDFFLQDWRKTWHAAISYMDMYQDEVDPTPDFEWLYIPQSLPGDINGFMESYLRAVEDPRITWLGLPRALSYAITDNPLARVEFARLVKKQHPHLHLHAFGMVNGDVHELPYLAAAGVESIDSSAPVWRGWMCNRIDDKFDRALWDSEGIQVDFSRAEMLDEKVCPDVIKHNLEACGVKTNP